jgi:hypothetical protein
MGSGDPTRRRTDYYPEWLDKLADDVTLEAAAMDGFVQGADDVRSVVLAAKSLYEYQDFNYLGPCGDNGFLEDYTTQVHGDPCGVVVVIIRDADGVVHHIVVNHRPRSTLLSFSRLMFEKFAGTPLLSIGKVPREGQSSRTARNRARRFAAPVDPLSQYGVRRAGCLRPGGSDVGFPYGGLVRRRPG